MLHHREHFDLDHGKINLNKMEIFSLPVSLAGFLPHPEIPMIYAENEDDVDNNIYINTQFYTPNVNDKGMDIITLKANDLIFKQNDTALVLKQQCLNVPKCQFITQEEQKLLRQNNLFAREVSDNICSEPEVIIKEEPEDDYNPVITMPIISKVESLQDKLFTLPHCIDCDTPQKTTMAEHYKGENRPLDPNLNCAICKFIAPTECSLKAHIRIHTKSEPFVCPDCGKNFPKWNQLGEHMTDVCFHLVKQVRFRCPGKKCGKLFASNINLTNHFVNHLKCLYMCSMCHTAFFNAESAQDHEQCHNGDFYFNKVYDCYLCPNNHPLNENNYLEHVELHTGGTDKGMYVYICKKCRSYFRSTATYATHILRCSTKHNYTDIKKTVYPSKYITKECETCYTKLICTVDNPIKICQKCRISRQKSSHITRYYCILCNKQISVDEKITHMKFCKYSKPQILISRLSLDDVSNSSFGSSGSESSSSPTKSYRKRLRNHDSEENKKKKKRTYIPNYRNKKPEVELDLTAEKPVRFDGTYHCKLCDYSNTERTDFHGHVKSHRDISTAYQCMECGECFVVKPSLIKHLLHFHNIADSETYLSENDCYDVEAMKELEDVMNLAPGESKEPVKENQCRVCLKEFEDSLTLNTHFRIHGMAFLLKNSK